MATIKDVAARAGVSYTTVSHVINKTRAVAPATKQKVENAIKELGYAPNVVARGLRKGKSKTIGVVSISTSDIYFAEILQGLQERAWEKGYGVYVSYSDLCDVCRVDAKIKDKDPFCLHEQKLLDDLQSRDIQGLILNSLQPDHMLLDTLKAHDFPSILFQRDLPIAGWDNYLSDDYQGSTDAMNYLIAKGHTRIGLVEAFSYESHTVKYRKKAWEDCLRKNDLDPDPELVCDGRFDLEGAYQVTKELMELSKPPSAILYYSDPMAMAGIRAAVDLGLKVPDDLSVIGYDNLHFTSITVPRLTSVNQLTYQIGRDMVDRLITRIDDTNTQPVVKKYAQNLVVRESVSSLL